MTTSTITQTIPRSSDIELHAVSSHTRSVPNHKIENSLPATATSDETPPLDATPALESWNSPPENKYRVLSAFWSFAVIGMNDGSYGALIPHLEEYYNLNYTVVSLVFLSPFVGYALAALVNNLMHVKFGQRGVATIGPLCHILSFIVFSFHPPYPVLVVMFTLVGLGNGLIDAAWCAWLGHMVNANEVSGFLHGCYALGATVAPLIATALITKGNLGWYSFYYLMVGMSSIEFLTSSYTFWPQTGAVYLLKNPREINSTTGRTREALKKPLTWIFALFLFGYMGTEGNIPIPLFRTTFLYVLAVGLGGWIVVFMTRVRGASQFGGGATATGFWGGMTVGRLVLGFVTGRIGESRAGLLYLCLTIGLQLVFWQVSNLVVSAVSVALLGVFIGPMFGTAIVLITKLLPKSLHVGTIGFATAFGGSGGAVFPFIIGAVAQAKGVQTFQPFILALLVAIAILWFIVPRGNSKEKLDDESGSPAISGTLHQNQIES